MRRFFLHKRQIYFLRVAWKKKRVQKLSCQGLHRLKITICNNILRCQKLFKVKDRVKDSVCILSVNLCEIYFNGLCHLANSDNIVFCQSPPLTDFTKESKALGYYHLKGDNIINISLTFLSAMIPFQVPRIEICERTATS